MTYNPNSSSAKLMKLAEKFFILCDRQQGVMTRLYHMKTVLSTPEFRPPFLPGGEKVFDSGWKLLMKKFPALDAKQNHSSLQPFVQHSKEICSYISPFYHDFADCLDLRHNLTELLTTFAAESVHLDITVNTDTTKMFLDLITNQFAIIVLISRISDMRPILALYNFLYEQSNMNSEPSYRRLCEHFVDPVETLVRNLHNEIYPYFRLIADALASLQPIFIHRTLRAKNWNDGNFLNLLSDPASVTHPVLSGQLSCQLIPFEVMERWILFGYLLIFPELQDDTTFNRFKIVLKNTYVAVVFRDEVINIHSFAQNFLEVAWNHKLASKRIAEIKDAFSYACSQAPSMHFERRTYLRTNLRQLSAFLVFWSLSYACDELRWMLRHYANPANKKISTAGAVNQRSPLFEEIVGHSVPELLFYMDDLRMLVTRHAPVIQRYYLSLLMNYDAPGLSDMLRDLLPAMSAREVDIFNGIHSQISSFTEETIQLSTGLSADGTQSEVSAVHLLDFSSIRLDWLRLQTYFAADSASNKLRECKMLLEHMQAMVFHTKLVDFLDEMLRQSSDCSLFYFYQAQLKELALDCRQCPSQLRFSIVFPSICSQFVNTCHVICPEERALVGSQAVDLALFLLHNLAEHLCACVLVRIDEYGALADQLASHNAVSLLVEHRLTKKKKRSLHKGRKETPMGTLPNSMLPNLEMDPTLRKGHKVINPREVVQNELQLKLIDILSKYTLLVPIPNSDRDRIVTKPSDLLRRLRALLDVVVGLERHLTLDIVSLYSVIMNQHTMFKDVFKGELTMTSHYTQWYCEVFLWHAQADHFVFSPTLKSFVTMATPDVVRFRAEDYADYNEFRALSEIIGPVGVRFLCDQLMGDVNRRLEELRKLVAMNRTTLEPLQELAFRNPAKAKQLAASLQKVEQFNQLLKEIGVTLSLRKLIMEAAHDVFKVRIVCICIGIDQAGHTCN
ncbi:Nck-associated protein 1 [Cichlidogyrus casuarinus]|uniref:Nck-associated protein 1 n=1 Tax=Cichlidogyrus casuarinus TaxID=1844966 RepID=A0ABD2QL71_9PLAT